MNKLFKEIDTLQQEINALRPLKTEELPLIKNYYTIGLTYSSNALEGNSLTETETKIVLEEGITIGGKPLRDHLEAIGHEDALAFLYTCVDKKTVEEKDILQLHRLFYYRIDEKNAGIYRSVKAYITGSKYPLPIPENIPALMHNFILLLPELYKTKHPVEYAALAHMHFVFIHPFVDGNGRTARLLMNLILLQSGYNIAIIPPVMRHAYIASLEKAHHDPTDFITLIAQMVKETQKDYLRLFA